MNSTFVTHPSVRIKGSENNYNPVQCFDTSCRDQTPHMHCPFCVKTDAYSDPVILKAHYRVKHVDKGIDFAGLKVLRCCDRCDIVGVIKGEKKFKGAHWHCYKCKNGFNRRDEAIKHYKTHFRNPQTTFQIQIAQEVNQSVNPGFDSDEAAHTIQSEEFSVHSVQSIHPVLTEAVTCMASVDDQTFTQTSNLPVIQRTFEGGVSMPGVGAMETVGVADTQTIMIIQDEEASLQEQCDVSVNESYNGMDDSSPKQDADQLHKLLQSVHNLEMEKLVNSKEIEMLKKKVQEQEEEITYLKVREQELLDQFKPPSNKRLETLCEQLEAQHKDLLQQQLSHLRHAFFESQNIPAKIVLVNNNTLASQLEQQMGLDTCTIKTDISGGISLDFEHSNAPETHTGGQDETGDSIHAGMENNEEEDTEVKCEDKGQPEFEILQQDFADSIEEDRLQIEDEHIPIENDGQEPPPKRLKEK